MFGNKAENPICNQLQRHDPAQNNELYFNQTNARTNSKHNPLS